MGGCREGRALVVRRPPWPGVGSAGRLCLPRTQPKEMAVGRCRAAPSRLCCLWGLRWSGRGRLQFGPLDSDPSSTALVLRAFPAGLPHNPGCQRQKKKTAPAGLRMSLQTGASPRLSFCHCQKKFFFLFAALTADMPRTSSLPRPLTVRRTGSMSCCFRLAARSVGDGFHPGKCVRTNLYICRVIH